jgi:hypothetical protein
MTADDLWQELSACREQLDLSEARRREENQSNRQLQEKLSLLTDENEQLRKMMRDGPVSWSEGIGPASRPFAGRAWSRPEEFTGPKGSLSGLEEGLASRINVLAKWEEDLVRFDEASGDAAAPNRRAHGEVQGPGE